MSTTTQSIIPITRRLRSFACETFNGFTHANLIVIPPHEVKSDSSQSSQYLADSTLFYDTNKIISIAPINEQSLVNLTVHEHDDEAEMVELFPYEVFIQGDEEDKECFISVREDNLEYLMSLIHNGHNKEETTNHE